MLVRDRAGDDPRNHAPMRLAHTSRHRFRNSISSKAGRAHHGDSRRACGQYGDRPISALDLTEGLKTRTWRRRNDLNETTMFHGKHMRQRPGHPRGHAPPDEAPAIQSRTSTATLSFTVGGQIKGSRQMRLSFRSTRGQFHRMHHRHLQRDL